MQLARCRDGGRTAWAVAIQCYWSAWLSCKSPMECPSSKPTKNKKSDRLSISPTLVHKTLNRQSPNTPKNPSSNPKPPPIQPTHHFQKPEKPKSKWPNRKIRKKRPQPRNKNSPINKQMRYQTSSLVSSESGVMAPLPLFLPNLSLSLASGASRWNWWCSFWWKPCPIKQQVHKMKRDGAAKL